jgi:hypothetical protein
VFELVNGFFKLHGKVCVLVLSACELGGHSSPIVGYLLLFFSEFGFFFLEEFLLTLLLKTFFLELLVLVSFCLQRFFFFDQFILKRNNSSSQVSLFKLQIINIGLLLLYFS